MAYMCADSGNLMAIAQQVIQQQQKHRQQQQQEHHQQQQMNAVMNPFGFQSPWTGNNNFPFSDSTGFYDPYQTEQVAETAVTEMMKDDGGFQLSGYGSAVGRDEFDSDEWMETLITGDSAGVEVDFPMELPGMISETFVPCSPSSSRVNGGLVLDLPLPSENPCAVPCSSSPPLLDIHDLSPLPPPQIKDVVLSELSPVPPSDVVDTSPPLLQSLVDCARLIGVDPQVAAKSLLRVKESSFKHGDPTERVSFYFSKALYQCLSHESIRINPQSPPSISSPSPDEFTLCYKTLNDACPYTKFAHLTANQAILESTESSSRIHIIDFGIVQGVQWAALLQALATRSTGKPDKIRISGIPSPEHPESSSTSGAHLEAFAKLLNLDFEFIPVLSPVEELTKSSFDIHPDESIVVNFMFHLHLLLDDSSTVVERLLRLSKSLSPTVVTLGEFELNSNNIGFAQRVANAIGFYSAAFESLDEALDRESPERERVECEVLGNRILSTVVKVVGKRRMRMEEKKNWTVQMERCGFRKVPLSHYALSQAKILLWNYSSRYCLVESSPGFLSLGWDNRPLLSVSSWN